MRGTLCIASRVLCLALLPACVNLCAAQTASQTSPPEETNAPAQTSPAVPEAPPVLVAPQPHIAAGQPFSVKGKLQVRYRGWAIFLTVPLEHRTLADLGSQGAKYVTAIQLQSEGNWKLLAKHAGEIVEATGELQMGSASSAGYWNGVMLQAESVKLADGSTVQPQAHSSHEIPDGVGSYMVTVTMQPNHVEWPHVAVEIGPGTPLPDAEVEGCTLGGVGDVLNCSCSEGFEPVRAGIMANAVAAKDWQTIPAAKMIEPGTAQFGLTDPDANSMQTYQVVCKRKVSTLK